MTKYGADKGTLTRRRLPPDRHVRRPGGTRSAPAPFKLESWKVGDKLVIARNDSYWGTKAMLRR